MGWAKKNLGQDQRAAIAKSLFSFKEEGTGGWLNGLCPLHEDENPSFGYHPGDDVFHCHAGCQKDGDLVDLFCLVNGLDKKSGFVEFKKRYGSESGGTEKSGAASSPGRAKKAAPKSESPAAASDEEDQVEGGETNGRAEGEEKGEKEPPPLKFEIMREAYGKFAPLPPAWIKRLWELRRWSPAIIEQLGIKLQTHYRCKKSGKLRQLSPSYARIAIPVFDREGLLQNIRLYDPAAKENKIISWGKGTGENRLFPYPGESDVGLIWLCEGEGDTIAARAMGLNAYTQTAKRKRWPEDQLAPFKDRDVVIAYDADEPGQEYARAAADSLLAVAKSVRILQWPAFMMGEDGSLPKKHGQDLTDFIVRHGKSRDDLEQLLPEAKTIDADSNDYVSPWNFFAQGITGRYGFQPRLLAERLIADMDLMFDPESELLHRWNGQYWEVYEVSHLKKKAIEYLGDESQRTRYNDAVDQAILLSTMPPGRKVNDCEGWLCLKNGMFNINTFELKPHHRDYYATIQIGVEFDPMDIQGCPRWLQFLKETIQTDGPIEQFQEFYGYCLTRETRYEMCLINIGDGGDGKSKALNVLSELVGQENCTAVSFEALEDQFQRVQIYNKMLNLSSEVGGQAMESEYFKKIVSGDMITASFKHKDGFKFKPFCKMVFAVNKMPKVKDTTDGLYRRLLPIKFKRQFLPGDPDRDAFLDQKLLAEMSGIFAWALQGLDRLRKRGYFDTSHPETQELLNEYKRSNSPVHAFVEDCCILGDSNLFAEKTAIYRAYVAYCGKNGFGTLHAEHFYIELRRVVKGLQSYRPRLADNSRPRVFSGIGLLSTAPAAE